MVAYQLSGDGPFDVLHLRGVSSNVDLIWDVPPLAHALARLSSFSRLITIDRRGSGLSDPVPLAELGSPERYVDDIVTVLEAAGSERAAVLAEFDAAPIALLFAATYPSRTRALVLWNGFARHERTDGYDVGVSRDAADELLTVATKGWGTEQQAVLQAGAYAHDPAVVKALAKLQRNSCTPAMARRLMVFQRNLDVRRVLSAVQAPTLVLAREAFSFVPASLGRYIADHIDGARFEACPGSAAGFFVDVDADEILDTIESFLTGAAPATPSDRVLATVLYSDIVASTVHAADIGDRAWRMRLDAHDREVSAVLDAHRGRLVKRTGDGVLATFEGPGHAVRCATALRHALSRHDLEVRIGLHCGEIELRGEDIGGIAVHIAARIMNEAGAGEILCSRTVKDLAVGSPIAFEDRGSRTLKGVPEPWQLYAASLR